MLKYMHTIAYTAMSAGYAGTCIGLDKTTVSIVLAVVYLLLAVSEWPKTKR